MRWRELASALADFSRATVTCRSFPADDRFRSRSEGDSGCRAATDTVPSYLQAAVEAETREEVQERLGLRTCERGHDPFLSRREQRFQAPPQPGAASSNTPDYRSDQRDD
jgi:hypothetical protein